MRGSGGGSLVVSEMKAAMELSFPPAPTSHAFRINENSPLRRNSRASRQTVGRKPTPCTRPRILISMALPRLSRRQAANLSSCSILVPTNAAPNPEPGHPIPAGFFRERRPKSVDEVLSEIKKGVKYKA